MEAVVEANAVPRAGINRWLVLVLVCVAQFMVVLDATIVNVALPSIQHGLGFSRGNLQWIVNAYALVFGGFLLLGGRASDLLGRQRLFIAGVIVFTVASLINGIATTSGHPRCRPRIAGPRRGARVARRTLDRHHDLQGRLGAHEGTRCLERDRRRRRRRRPDPRRPADRDALVALGLLHQPADRDRSGVALAALHPEQPGGEAPGDRRRRGRRHRHGGLLVLVYGIVKAQDYGWASGKTLGLAALAIALLGAFVVIEQRSKAPLIRLGIFRLRTLSAGNVAMLLVAVRALLDVLLRIDLPAGGARLQPAAGRFRVPAVHLRDRDRGGRVAGADQAHRHPRGVLRRHGDGSRRDALPDAAR